MTDKYKAQIHLQMFATGKKKGLFCIADPDFERNQNVHQTWITFDQKFMENLLNNAMTFWKENVFYKMKDFILSENLKNIVK